ncbi:MAG: sigma-54-dependent transcriptional regulator [Verrucomicrobiota bacterium]
MQEKKLQNAKILVVEDDEGLSELLQEELEDWGVNVKLEHTAEKALSLAGSWLPDVVVSDLRLPGADGLSLLRRMRSEITENQPDFLIITAFGTVPKAVESLKAGAEEFLTKPLDFEHFKLAIHRILEKRDLRQEINEMRNLMDGNGSFHGMYGHSAPMQALFQRISQIAKADGPVLITGESGTGKELVARAIHAESKPADSPFLAVNCAGIPEHLLESEFFGHAAGAFTGAGKARQGIFAEAEGGTLLLDEISEMPAALQAKLLRMLQDGKIRPVGSNREQQVNVRVIAATNRDIESLVQEKEFREDLFYRLETFTINIPPLREREEDIDLLAGIFLNQHACSSNKSIKGLSPQVQKILHSYNFPGNVRELQNSIERAVVFCQDDEILPEHLPARIQQKCSDVSADNTADQAWKALAIDDNSLPTLEEIERRYIEHVVKKVNGNKKQAASILDIGRRTLYRRLEELNEGLDIEATEE